MFPRLIFLRVRNRIESTRPARSIGIVFCRIISILYATQLPVPRRSEHRFDKKVDAIKSKRWVVEWIESIDMNELSSCTDLEYNTTSIVQYCSTTSRTKWQILYRAKGMILFFSRDEALLFTRMISFYHRLYRNIIRRVTGAATRHNGESIHGLCTSCCWHWQWISTRE